MIILLSDEKDPSTNNVIDWLIHYNVKYLRVGNLQHNAINNLVINNDEVNFEIINNVFGKIDLSKITSIWFRKSHFQPNKDIEPYPDSNNPNEISINNYIVEEEEETLYGIYNIISKHKKTLGNWHYHLNKINQLNIALISKLKIPNTLVTKDKETTISFLEKNKNIISKGIKNNINIRLPHTHYYALTHQVNKKMLYKTSNKFGLTLFQNKINKLFEIRTFFIENKFWSMAIFSQNNSKTKLDYRNYDDNNSNRTVPFKLPKEVEKKLKRFSKIIGIIELGI